MRWGGLGLWLARIGLTGGTLAAWLLAVPAPAEAHAIGQVFTLPVPLGLYLAGAALAVAASFAVSVVVIRPARGTPSYPTWQVPAGIADLHLDRSAAGGCHRLGGHDRAWLLGRLDLAAASGPVLDLLLDGAADRGRPARQSVAQPEPVSDPVRRPRANCAAGRAWIDWTPASPTRAASAAGRRSRSCSPRCGRSSCCRRASRRSPSPT